VYHRLIKALATDEGDMLVLKGTKRFDGDQPTPRILIHQNEELKGQVYEWSHTHPSAGHIGMNATGATAALKFYSPGMASYLKRRVKACDVFLAKQTKVNLHETVHKPRRHGFPGEVLYVDLVGPMPQTAKMAKYIVTKQDGFSRYVNAVNIPCKEAEVLDQ
jgi:hypothetical protein